MFISVMNTEERERAKGLILSHTMGMAVVSVLWRGLRKPCSGRGKVPETGGGVAFWACVLALGHQNAGFWGQGGSPFFQVKHNRGVNPGAIQENHSTYGSAMVCLPFCLEAEKSQI